MPTANLIAARRAWEARTSSLPRLVGANGQESARQTHHSVHATAGLRSGKRHEKRDMESGGKKELTREPLSP